MNNQFPTFIKMESLKPIVFYDGDCGFCNRSVAYVMKHDRSRSIHFAALQSDFTKALFKEKGWESPDLSTFYFFENGKLYQKSTAALRVASYFKFPQSLMRAGWIFPRFIRDSVYNGVAKRRQRLSKGFCVMPSPEERKRFISEL